MQKLSVNNGGLIMVWIIVSLFFYYCVAAKFFEIQRSKQASRWLVWGVRETEQLAINHDVMKRLQFLD